MAAGTVGNRAGAGGAGGTIAWPAVKPISLYPDVLGKRSTWYKTSVRSYANLSGLNTLASDPDVTTTVARAISGNQQTVTITLKNTSATNIAFFVRPEITAGNGGTEVTRVTYTDNHGSLFPGETSTITATYETADLGGQWPYLRVRGFNVPTTSFPIP